MSTRITRFAACYAVLVATSLPALAQNPPVAAPAAPVTAPADARAGLYEKLLEKTQRDANNVSPEDFGQLMKLAKELGRPYAASLAAKAFLTQRQNPTPEMYRQAAEVAQMAGDFRTAISRYKQYFKTATPSPEASDAAASMYQLQVDYLGAVEDAYRCMADSGGKFRQSIRAKRYDAWFLKVAKDQKAYADMAKWLVLVMQEKMPLEQERLLYWESMDMLMDEIGKARPEHFAALPACREIVNLVRNSPARSADYAFLVANLAFNAAAAGKDEAALGREFPAVAAAAKAYIDAAPKADTLLDIMNRFGGVGPGAGFDGNLWNRCASQKRDVFAYGITKLADPEKEVTLQRLGGLANVVAMPDQWVTLASQFPEVMKKSWNAYGIQLLYNANNPDTFKKQAAYLPTTTTQDAAVIRSMAVAGDDLWAGLQNLVQKESWYLSAADIYPLLSQRMWPAFSSYPRDDAKKLPPGYWEKIVARFGTEIVAKTPVAFHADAARDSITTIWRLGNGTDANDKSTFPAVLRTFDWVPYTADERRQIFGPAHDEFKGWANQVRATYEAAKKANNADQLKTADAAAKLLPIIEEAFKLSFDPKICDPTKGPDATCQNLAKAVLAVRAKKVDDYLAAAKPLCQAVRSYEAQKTPFGAWTLGFALENRITAFDTIDFQCEVLTDLVSQLTDAANRAPVWNAVTVIMANRPEWGMNGAHSRYKDKMLKLNDVFAKGVLALAAKNQFWPDLFDWFRGTRRGNGWQAAEANADVLAKLIDQKLFLSQPGFRPHPSATCTYMWLVRNEFQSLAAKYPPERAFDDLFCEEVRQTGFIDNSFWYYSYDEKKKAATLAAEMLAKTDAAPFGYNGEKPAYPRQPYWEIFGRALNATDAARNAMLAKWEGDYGKTRFDDPSMGRVQIRYLPDTATPEGRAQFFQRLNAYADRAAASPARVGLPFMQPLERMGAPDKLTKDEATTLVRAITTCQPPQWWGGERLDVCAAYTHQALVAQKRGNELFALIPVFWKMAKDTNNEGNMLRTLTKLGSDLQDAGLADQAVTYGSVGLDLLGSAADDIKATLTAMKSKGLSGAGAVIPVDRGDARYPLYAAQAAYLTGNIENAWELYTTHKNLLSRMVKELDSSFCIWLIDRNNQTGNFDDAEAVARDMIQWMDSAQQGFDPEMRAKLLLAYADIATARQEYPRARALYERIAVAQEFEGTQARRTAELRIAETDRVTKKWDAAIERLEKLVRKRDPYLQTEGNYLLALTKYDQEEFLEARKYLEQVFAIEPSHAPSSILNGKLNLKLKNLQAATKVIVGLPGDQKTLIPGKPLTIQLEDRNLAIVGRSSNIEIRVTTASGDEENISLLPFGDSKTKFEGQIGTALGPTKKGSGVLDLLGKDTVQYDFSDKFKKANNIKDSVPSVITIASDAELYCSSGKILTKEEQEQLAMERMLRQKGILDDAAAAGIALNTVRAEDEVKPGSPINVRVVDPDRSATPQKDKITLRVATTSGDLIDNFALEETEPFSGVFEGRIPTASAPITAYSSDSEEGKEPVFAITTGNYPAWVGLPNNERPKVFNVDLNQNLALGKMNIQADVPGRHLKKFMVQTSRNGKAFTSVAGWPGNLPEWNGALRMELVRLANVDRPFTTIGDYREYFEVGAWAAGAEKQAITPAKLSATWDASVAGNAAPMGLTERGLNSAYACRITGAFVLPTRQVRTFRIDHKNRTQGIQYFIAIDGEISKSLDDRRPNSPDRNPYEITKSLSKGVHTIEVYVGAQRNANPTFELLYDTAEPPYMVPCTLDFFDPAKHPEISAIAKFKPGEIKADQNNANFEVKFPAGVQGRVLRLVLADFETDAPGINKITLTDANDKPILPTQTDLAALKKNQTLEILPGDRVTLTYDDPTPVSKEKGVLEASMKATYHNATLSACFVESALDGSGNRKASYIPMRRFKPGDTINVFINEPDGDTTETQDKLTFTARTLDGKPVELDALETEGHSGIFIGKVFPIVGDPQRPSEIKVGKSDDIVITYLDKENTDPGIPWERTYALEQTTSFMPDVRVFNILSRDLTSEELKTVPANADARHTEEFIPVTRTLTASRPSEPQTDKNPAVALFGAPLVVEIVYPTVAQSPLSMAALYVQTSSGRKKYGKEPEGEFDINVPGTIKLERQPGDLGQIKPPAGYRDVLIRGNPQAGDALEDGRFMFLIPTRLGKVPETSLALGDKAPPKSMTQRAASGKAAPKKATEATQEWVEINVSVPYINERGEVRWNNQLAFLPALAIRGDDDVFIGFQFKDEAGAAKWITRKVILSGDIAFDVMDRRYQNPVSQVHVGETLYFRVINPKLDLTDEKDDVVIQLTSPGAGNATVKLTEAFGHSGVFKGYTQVVFAGDAAAQKAPVPPPAPAAPKATEKPADGKATDPAAPPAKPEIVSAATVPVNYGDLLKIKYQAPQVAAITQNIEVFKGADGSALPFTKRFKDAEIAVQTQFTIAEAYFSLANKHRELGQDSLARREIAQGKKLLEEAIRDYPNSEARAQADYLLANLALEFANEAKDEDAKQKHYLEAVNRFSDIVASYPDSAYAPKAQYKKALVFEKMGKIDEACEEYVKLSYRYPDNELVAETIARLGQYFLTKSKELKDKISQEQNPVEQERLKMQAKDQAKTAAQVFGRLASRFPAHSLAGKTTVLSAQCYMRAEELDKAIEVFTQVVDNKKADSELVAQSMYWAGDCHMKKLDYINAYRSFKKLTWDYPETTWAKYARGRLTEDAMVKAEENSEKEASGQ